jgi:two-component system response regulator MprA
MTVLVVDDDEAMRDSLRFSLESEGIDVEVASGTSEAVRAISEKEFDAVVTDLAMAGDGEHVLEQMHSLRPGTPVIVVTGQASAPKRRSVARRAHAVLSKPIPIERLIKVLRNAMKPGARPKRPRR